MTEYNKYIDVSKSYLYSQIKIDKNHERDSAKGVERKVVHLPFVTISRETGARGTTIAKALVEYMTKTDKHPLCPWTLFDKNLVDEIFNKYSYMGIERLLPERRFSDIQGLFEELFGLHPTKREMVYKISDSIKKFARMGNVVIIGRGAAFLTKHYSHGFHVRFIGSFEKRTKVIMNKFDMDKKRAENYIRTEDLERVKYVKKLYDFDITDPHHYDVVVNTDRLCDDEIVRMLSEQIYNC